MNLEQILKNILTVADYPKDKQQKFINTFYQYLFTKILAEIDSIDPRTAQNLSYQLTNVQENPDVLNKIWDELYQNPKIKEKIDQISEEVIGELADDISQSATDSQKQQILASLPV